MSASRRLVAPLVTTAVVAAAMRFLYAEGLSHHPEFVAPVLDSAANLEWARGLLAGTWPGSEPFFRPPGYLVALAGLVRLAGEDPARVVAWQLVLGTATPLLACLLAARIGGVAAAWVAGLGAALYPTFLFFDGQLLTPFLVVPTFLAAVLLGDVARAEGRGGAAVASGLLFGIAGSAWPLVLPVGGGLVVVLARARRARDAALATVALLAAPLAATIHNVAAGEPAIVATQGGLNFYLGNGPDADGMSATFAEAPTALGYRMVEAAARVAERREGRRLSASEVSSHYLRRTLVAIAAEPGRWLRLMAKKAQLVLSAREIPNNHDLALFRQEIGLLRLPGWGTWLPLALVGAWMTRRRGATRWTSFAAAVVLAGCVVFFVNDRFRVPAAPLVVALGAVGVVEIGGAVRERRARTAAVAVAASAGLVALVRWNPWHVPVRPWVMSYVMVAEAERDRGELVRSLRWIDRALAEQPGLYPARLARIELLRRTGRTADARREVEEALAAWPEDAALLHEHAVLLDLAGESPAALAEVERAIAADPTFEPARVSRAVILVGAGRTEEAAETLRAFLARGSGAAEAARARQLLDEIRRGAPRNGAATPGDAEPGELTPTEPRPTVVRPPRSSGG